MSVDLSVIIVNWNTCELLTACLESVATCQRLEVLAPDTNRLTAEVFVVDNASTDGSVTTVRGRFPWVQLIENAENVGFGRASNQAIARSAGRYCLLLNSDILVPYGAISCLVQVADEHPEVGAMGCMLRDQDGGFQASYNDFPTLTGEWLSAMGVARRLLSPQYPSHTEPESQETRLVDWIPGAVMLLRTAALRQVGGFDERYSMYSEETDLCWRLWKAGWRVLYTPKVQITHLGGGSASRVVPKQVLTLYKSKRIFFERTRGTVAGFLFSMGVRLVTACKIGGWLVGLALIPSGQREYQLRKIRGHLPLMVTGW